MKVVNLIISYTCPYELKIFRIINYFNFNGECPREFDMLYKAGKFKKLSGLNAKYKKMYPIVSDKKIDKLKRQLPSALLPMLSACHPRTTVLPSMYSKFVALNLAEQSQNVALSWLS